MIALINTPREESLQLEVYLFQKDRDLGKVAVGRKLRSFIREQFFSDEERKSIELTEGNRRILIHKLNSRSRVSNADLESFRKLGVSTVKRCNELRANSMQVMALGRPEALHSFCEGALLAGYAFDKYLTVQKPSFPQSILAPGLDDSQLKELNAIQEAVGFSRDLVNEPLQGLSATDLANRIEEKGKECGFATEIFNKKKIESLKMGGILAVNRGSLDPPSFTVLEWKPKNPVNEKPIAIVGKGVVYDTGGLSLKPTAGSMDSMKSDMGGAAAVAGAFIMASRMNLPVHLVGFVPSTDNRPGVNAYTPGDIITMFDGTTVEVLNTDAEGRMLLADALSYAKKYSPELTINLATLTGSAAMAIGTKGVVAMGNADDSVFEKLSTSGHEVHERLAVFPFWDDYKEMLNSPIADMKNIGGREAGAITAGKFLEHFTDYPFVHLDIAGPAFLNADDAYRTRGGTGVGVRLLYNFLKNLS